MAVIDELEKLVEGAGLFIIVPLLFFIDDNL